MRVLGIDPGYAIVGWGVVDYAGNRFAPVDFGAVCTDAGVPFERRLDEVYAGIKEVIERTQPEVLAIEKLFYQHNQTTVIGVAEARGVILLAAAQAGLPIYEYTPMQVKQAVTGYGKAVKKQVQEMTRILLRLPAIPKPDDTADALAMAITFCHTNGNQLNRFRSERCGRGRVLRGVSMIYCLTGKIVKKTPERRGAQLRRRGLLLPSARPAWRGRCPVWGKEATIYTVMSVTENDVSLYGFATEEQQACFEMLTAVSGVGPKVGLAILSVMEPDRVALAISAGDHKAFKAASGVGPKLAQRIVLELKDKVAKGFVDGIYLEDVAGAAADTPAAQGAGQAIAALVSLGYSQSEAALAVSKIDAHACPWKRSSSWPCAAWQAGGKRCRTKPRCTAQK